MHKRVCGERSNPFQWPDLTPDEISDMLEISQLPSVINERLTTWLDEYSDRYKLPSTFEVRRRSFEASYSEAANEARTNLALLHGRYI